MENLPDFSDYCQLIYNRFRVFRQDAVAVSKLGAPYVYEQESLRLFFMWMQARHIVQFKSQWRWLKGHPEVWTSFNWTKCPHRTTLSRRYKALYPVLQEFILFLGKTSRPLGEEFATDHLYEDKSLFKARGAVWHQSDRQQGRIPEKVRCLDTDASWSKSAYHGWVYGYGLHLTCNRAGFPVWIEVETATFSEKQALLRKEPTLLHTLQPQTRCGDDAYTLVKTIRAWAKQGIILLAPALRWHTGRYAQAYHPFLEQPDIAPLLYARKTTIEPVFDLIAKLRGTTAKQKQLAISRLANVRTAIALAVFTLQLAMLANSVWGLPFRSISHLQSVFR